MNSCCEFFYTMRYMSLKDVNLHQQILCLRKISFNTQKPLVPILWIWELLQRSYGYVDNDTPELSISLLPEYRGKGIGTTLLFELLNSLKMKNCRYVSLSVQKANTAALWLYRKAGFRIVEDKGDELVMKIDLENNEAVFAIIR